MKPEATIDPAAILARLPNELKRAIKNFTFLFQMHAYFGTNDLEDIARTLWLDSSLAPDQRKMACWLTTLVSSLN